jgi:hypothetical protein
LIDYARFRQSLERLQEQYANHRRGAPERSNLDREGIAASVIRRFATCYDCLWNVLKRYLTEELGVADVPNSPKPIFRLANENLLFTATVDHWLRYADARIDTSHDYDGQKAQDCLALVPGFIGNAIQIFQTMSGATWK